MLMKLFQWQASGPKDWLWQRITASIFIVYATIVTLYWVIYPSASLDDWRNLIFQPIMQALGLVALFSMLLHAWIGLWVVITDYIKPPFLHKLSIYTVLLLITIYLIAGITILWGG